MHYVCQKVPWESLVDSWKVLGQQDLMYVVSARSQSTKNYNHPFLAHTYFTPVVDSFRGVDAILPTYPSEMIPQYAHVPVMLGVTTAECAAYITWLYYLVSRGSAKVDLEDLDFVVPDVSYANPKQIASDQNFVTPAAFEANIYASKGLSVHAYIYDHPLQGFEDNLAKYGLYDVGSANGYDMVLLGGTTEPVETPGEAYANGSRADQFVADLLSHTIANFVANEYGNRLAGQLIALAKIATKKRRSRLVSYPSHCKDHCSVTSATASTETTSDTSLDSDTEATNSEDSKALTASLPKEAAKKSATVEVPVKGKFTTSTEPSAYPADASQDNEELKTNPEKVDVAALVDVKTKIHEKKA